jgi:hypothetical protein
VNRLFVAARDQDIEDLLDEASQLTGHTALERMATLVKRARDELDIYRGNVVTSSKLYPCEYCGNPREKTGGLVFSTCDACDGRSDE